MSIHLIANKYLLGLISIETIGHMVHIGHTCISMSQTSTIRVGKSTSRHAGHFVLQHVYYRKTIH